MDYGLSSIVHLWHHNGNESGNTKPIIMSDENNKQLRPESYPKPTEMDMALRQQDEYTTLKPNEQGHITGVSQQDNPGEDNAANQEDVAENFDNYRKNREGE